MLKENKLKKRKHVYQQENPLPPTPPHKVQTVWKRKFDIKPQSPDPMISSATSHRRDVRLLPS